MQKPLEQTGEALLAEATRDRLEQTLRRVNTGVARALCADIAATVSSDLTAAEAEERVGRLLDAADRLSQPIPEETRRQLRAADGLLTQIRKGKQHPDAARRAAYEALAPLSLGEAAPIVRVLPTVTPRGRPTGRSHDDADRPLVEELIRRRDAGEGVEAVSLELAARAVGGGTIGSKAKRLRRRLGAK